MARRSSLNLSRPSPNPKDLFIMISSTTRYLPKCAPPQEQAQQPFEAKGPSHNCFTNLAKRGDFWFSGDGIGKGCHNGWHGRPE